MRYRTVKVREDVYERLQRIARDNGTTVPEVITRLVIGSEGIVIYDLNESLLNKVLSELREIREMLHRCLSNEASASVGNEGVGDEFVNNPWVGIIRGKYS